MKNFFEISLLLFATSLTSCMPANYYQLLTVKPVDSIQKTDDALVFEDSNCKISYYFWAGNGTTCIKFENKIDEDIYLDLSASFFFMNNQAFDLYTGVTTSNSITTSRPGNGHEGQGNTIGSEVSTNSTVVTQEQRMVTIPAKMYKIIDETNVHILEEIYRDCGLYLTPSKTEVKSMIFTKRDSPYTFGLRLSYYLGNSNEVIRVKNSFYVDQITNYPQAMFKETIRDDSYGCSDEKVPSKNVNNYFFMAPDAFYIKYDPARMGVYPGATNTRKH